MNRLIKIARSAEPSPGRLFRKTAYGSRGIRQFLRDVLSLANAAVDGPRYIVTGVEFDDAAGRQLRSIPADDFSGRPAYPSLVADFIEPPVRIRYIPLSIDGHRIGIYEIGDCQDKPYMMRVDQSEKLRRGDAYIRVDNATIKMGRRQLQELFEKKFREAVSSERIEVGFRGEIMHKELHVPTVNLAHLPSAVEMSKLREMIDLKQNSRASGSTTVLARLMHARLFGADDPYEDRSAATLIRDMSEIKSKRECHDQHFLFHVHASPVQIVIYNEGDEPVENATLALVMPNHASLHVATRLPSVWSDGQFVDRTEDENSAYPSVSIRNDSIHVSCHPGSIPAGSPVNAFELPLLVCAGSELAGRRIGIRYSLSGKNLRNPVTGTLRLIFGRASASPM